MKKSKDERREMYFSLLADLTAFFTDSLDRQLRSTPLFDQVPIASFGSCR